MNILQISFHTSPFGSVGKFDSGGLNVYVQQISKQLSNENNVTVVTAEKAENFKTDNLDFYSRSLLVVWFSSKTNFRREKYSLRIFVT